MMRIPGWLTEAARPGRGPVPWAGMGLGALAVGVPLAAPVIDEVVVLSTCNLVEVYAAEHGLAELLAFASRAQQHEVFDLVVREFPFTENGVFKSRRAANRYLEADGRLPIRG